jgi:hypothetical protein
MGTPPLDMTITTMSMLSAMSRMSLPASSVITLSMTRYRKLIKIRVKEIRDHLIQGQKNARCLVRHNDPQEI